MPLFKGLARDGSFLQALAEKLEVRTQRRKHVIIAKGDVGRELYFIVRGEAEVLTALDEPAFITLKEGSFFGESALLTEEPRNAFVRAKKTLQLYVLSKTSLAEVFKEFPDVEKIVKEPSEQRKIARIKAEEEVAAAAWLAEVSLFSGLAADDPFLKTLAKQLEVRSVAAETVIVEKGSIGHEMFFVVQGMAEMLNLLSEPPFDSLNAGSFFGESALLTLEPENAYVRAGCDMDLYVLSKEDLDSVFDDFPDVEEMIQASLEERSGQRQRAAHAHSGGGD